MSTEELVNQLSGIRIPESFARFGLQDALAAVALGLILGSIVLAILRVATIRRTRPIDRARTAIAALSRQERQARIAGLAALLRAHGEKMSGLDAALYDPAATIDIGALEAAVIDAARRARA
ncbi:hypothetical protein MLD63_07200 [Paracoccus sp. TK19116]|uniref:Uncharacterized protein n=1 Tax=Paracoccus albicereus TaxID=2922394 RepID=A0ABT1MPI3_9RHOB|nr:hypothetical protein [Paracoccus albicereus]MCQ0970205.1 hypothetical protein [Paracoccus albicereus]